jgi:hypothetical protein
MDFDADTYTLKGERRKVRRNGEEEKVRRRYLGSWT